MPASQLRAFIREDPILVWLDHHGGRNDFQKYSSLYEFTDFIFEKRNQFEAKLNWQKLESARACRISKEIEVGGYRDEGRWSEIQDKIIDAIIRLEKALFTLIYCRFDGDEIMKEDFYLPSILCTGMLKKGSICNLEFTISQWISLFKFVFLSCILSSFEENYANIKA